MNRRIVLSVLLAFAMATSAMAAETVTFKGKAQKGVEPIALTGKMTKPKGEGPFPAVVLLRGGSGIRPGQDVWAERIADWGYVALQVDSFGSRGVENISGAPGRIPAMILGYDAHAAKSYLAGLPFVDGNRIAVMGGSHGGTATLYAVSNPADLHGRPDPFQAGIAIYPWCGSLVRLDAPLLILIGELDYWCPAERCKQMQSQGETKHKVTLKVYPGAYHCFDVEGMDKIVRGHKLLYNPEAAADATVQVKNFLAKHLR